MFESVLRRTRVDRRPASRQRFERRTNVPAAIRFGVILAFAAPFLFFIGQYIWINHTTHGLLPALLDSLFQGVLDTLRMLIKHPIQGLIYLAVTTVLWRWAWRR